MFREYVREMNKHLGVCHYPRHTYTHTCFSYIAKETFFTIPAIYALIILCHNCIEQCVFFLQFCPPYIFNRPGQRNIECN